MKNLIETLQTPFMGSYDVIVCGGGIGGVTAAVAAARNGASVLLLEKMIQLGGLATAGLISWYEPICDGRGNKLMYGMAEELLKLSISCADDTLEEPWKQDPDHCDAARRYATYFSPTLFAMALDKWVLDAGVTILFDTDVVRLDMEGSICRGVVVENKTGRGYYAAKFLIDGTGDAELMCKAGVPCTLGENYLTYIAYVANQDTLQKAKESGNLLHSRHWTTEGSDLWGRGHPEGMKKLSGGTAEEVTEYVLAGRRRFYERMMQMPRESRDVSILPTMAQFRTVRRINGAYTLTEEDCGKHFLDSVGVAGDFANRGKCYELPFGILYHPDYENMMTVGRTVSSSGWAWEVTRVIPVAAATGQAAGIAAALCAGQNRMISRLPVEEVQNRLRDAGVVLKLKQENLEDEGK